MVLPLLALPPELQALFVLLLADVAIAGRLAQASQACKELQQQRLASLREERQLAAQARMVAYSTKKRAFVLRSSAVELFPTAARRTTHGRWHTLWVPHSCSRWLTYGAHESPDALPRGGVQCAHAAAGAGADLIGCV